LLKLKCVLGTGECGNFSFKKYSMPTMAQMPNLAPIETKQITVAQK
jgi:hypothetical protein